MKRSVLACWVMMTMALLVAAPLVAAQNDDAPRPPSNLTAEDNTWDGGDRINLQWSPSPDDPDGIAGYRIYRSMSDEEIAKEDRDELEREIKLAAEGATEATREALERDGIDPESDEGRARLHEVRKAAIAAARAKVEERQAARAGEPRFMFVDLVPHGTTTATVDKLDDEREYLFQVDAVNAAGVASPAIQTTIPISPRLWWFDKTRVFLGVIVVILCSAVVLFIGIARMGITLKVRKIAGLEAVDEAVGRATEMGRSCLFVPGIQDVNDIQTIAGINILSRVARTAAEYDARVEVPTARSLVMTTARETVQNAYLGAGRPDAYNKDLIYYVTDEQFGYVAYLSGMMVREKPAACFYLGSFYAESLILAETGNSIGAIQIAGTAQPAQLPFFVAACDYTLIGEEFFAASAYLTGSPEELGSLKGQDVGKLIVALFIIVGVALATTAVITENPAIKNAVTFIKEVMLT